MYKYLRKLMDVAETIGEVSEFCEMDWGDDKRLWLQGTTAEGKKFSLILEVQKEAVSDGH